MQKKDIENIAIHKKNIIKIKIAYNKHLTFCAEVQIIDVRRNLLEYSTIDICMCIYLYLINKKYIFKQNLN